MIADTNTNEIVDKMFKKYDTDSNERLSKFEFVSLVNDLSRSFGGEICPRDDLDTLFELIDTNGDRTISKKELSVLI